MLECLSGKLLVASSGVRDRCARQQGQALVEYALIISLIAIVAIAALQLTSTTVTKLLHKISEAL